MSLPHPCKEAKTSAMRLVLHKKRCQTSDVKRCPCEGVLPVRAVFSQSIDFSKHLPRVK